MVEHSTADREVSGSSPDGPCLFFSKFFHGLKSFLFAFCLLTKHRQEDKMEELDLDVPMARTTTLDKMDEDEKEKETTNLDTEMKLNGDEEDEIVKEIDVFMSQSLSNQLHILQYPLRPPWRPYNRSYLHEVRYKPVKKKMEMDFRVSKEELENNYDTQTTDPRKTYTLASSAPVEPKTNYVLGVLRGDQLHLTPVQGTFQFRPSFAHIDKADAEKKKREKAESGEEKELKDEKVVVSLIQQMVSS